MISGDPNILDESSDAGRRMGEYRQVLGHLDILLCRGNIFSFVKAFFGGLEVLKKKKYDIITAQDIEHSFLAWLLSKRFGVPWQMQIHTDIFSPYFVKSSVFNKLRVTLAKFLIPRARCVRVVSERVKESVVLFLRSRDVTHPLAPSLTVREGETGGGLCKISILPIFVDIEKIRSTPVRIDLHQKYPGYDFIILMASRLTKEKNIGMAIEVMRELIPPLQPLPLTKGEGRGVGVSPLLLIVGDGPERKNIESRIMDYELRDSVKIESFVPFETLVSYYKTADLYLLTSDYEGYGRTLVEAAAAGPDGTVGAGCKIISSDVGISHEILEDENIFQVGDVLALKERLLAAVGGQIKQPKPLTSQTKEDYLRLYKESLESCPPS